MDQNKLVNRIKKIVLGTMLGVCLLLGNTAALHASSFSIWASSAVVSPNEAFAVTIVAADCTGRVNISVSNGTASESSVWVENNSVKINVYAGSSGTVTVTAVPQTGFSDADGNTYNPGSRSVSVAISQSQGSSGGDSSPSYTLPSKPTPEVEPEEDPRSKNYDLKSLSVDQGTLTPKFSADVTSYKVSLPSDAKSIKVTAQAEDEKATVSGTGEKSLKAGDNVIEVTCTSEYGTSQVYTINVYVDEEPLVYLSYHDKKLGVVRNTDDVKLPEGFEASKVKTDDGEIIAWTNEQLNKTIVYLIDENDEKGFYLFEDGKVTSSFKPVEIAGRTMYLIDIPQDKQKLRNMTYTDVKIKDLELKGWTFDDKDLKDFIVIYVMNEKGETCYYQYEVSEETLQLFNGYTIDDASYDQLNATRAQGFVAAGVGAGAAIIMGIVLVLKLRRNK